jgi:DnaD/phage-associated family protein
MFFESFKSILLSDTLLPDIFIADYMPSLEGDCVKIYIYCLFLSKHNKLNSAEDIAKKLCLDVQKVKDSLTCLQSLGIIDWKDNGIVLNDLKEKELNKIYRMKTTSTPDEAILSAERNKKRNEIIYAINNSFFSGVMSPSWYTDIDAWFDRFKFDEDVMYALFQSCYDQNGLARNYILKVAENWHSKNIKNSFDLDNYSEEYKRFRDIRGKIVKKLKLSRNLTEYEDRLVDKWVSEYKYSFEIIELSLKKTTGKTNPNFNYLDAIISDWSKNGLKSKDDIVAFENNRKQTSRQTKESSIPQHNNFDQRKYGDEYYDNFFTNTVK